MKTRQELLGELKAARDHHRAEADRLDAAIAALDGPAPKPQTPVASSPTVCNCATLHGLIPCPVHGSRVSLHVRFVPGVWQVPAPTDPLLLWVSGTIYCGP